MAEILTLEKIRYAYARWREPKTDPIPPSGPMHRQFDHDWKGKRTPRPLEEIRYLCIHQTAIEFGVNARQIKHAGGSRLAAYYKRFEATPYHAVFLRNGDALHNNPPMRYTYHGYLWNRDSVGVAFEGRWPMNEEGRAERHTILAAGVVDEWRQGFARYVLMLRSDFGLDDLTIVTHRQCSKKTADPGEFVIREVVAPVARELQIPIDTTITRGKGKAWPRSWSRHVEGSQA